MKRFKNVKILSRYSLKIWWCNFQPMSAALPHSVCSTHSTDTSVSGFSAASLTLWLCSNTLLSLSALWCAVRPVCGSIITSWSSWREAWQLLHVWRSAPSSSGQSGSDYVSHTTTLIKLFASLVIASHLSYYYVNRVHSFTTPLLCVCVCVCVCVCRWCARHFPGWSYSQLTPPSPPSPQQRPQQ